MLMDMKYLHGKYMKSLVGVIQVGAHYGQEVSMYREIGCKNMILFEPLGEPFSRLTENAIPQTGENIRLYNIALGNREGTADMFVDTANSGMSSSILNPNLHVNNYPHIVFDKRATIKVSRLTTVVNSESINMDNYNLLSMDVQGYEMEVLKGAEELLPRIDYIITEVNTKELYSNCALLPEMDSFLQTRGFTRVETVMTDRDWGDALYVRNPNG
jgi:FkbM family methyltransferase